MAKQTNTKSASGRSSGTEKKAPARAPAKKASSTTQPKRSSTASMNASQEMATPTPSTPPRQDVMAGDRERMIQMAAYHIAEKDGFQSGKEQDYWFQAERQIDELLKGRREIH